MGGNENDVACLCSFQDPKVPSTSYRAAHLGMHAVCAQIKQVAKSIQLEDQLSGSALADTACPLHQDTAASSKALSKLQHSSHQEGGRAAHSH
eukprot:1157919-Pelagomonas_calceolata.AAC.5